MAKLIQKDKIIAAIRDGHRSARQIAEAIGVHYDGVCATLYHMHKTGILDRSKEVVDYGPGVGARKVWTYRMARIGKADAPAKRPVVDTLLHAIKRARAARLTDALVWQTASIAMSASGHELTPDECSIMYSEHLDAERKSRDEVSALAKLQAENAALQQDNERMRLALDAISEALQAAKELETV